MLRLLSCGIVALGGVESSVGDAIGFDFRHVEALLGDAIGFDVQYFMPEEFLQDLPLRNESLPQEVMSEFSSYRFKEYHDDDIDDGGFGPVYKYGVKATTILNSPAYLARRSICTKVVSPDGDPRVCSEPGDFSPRALIEHAQAGEAGRFRLQAAFYFRAYGFVDVHSKTCCCFGIVCWSDTICNDEIKLEGDLIVESIVSVTIDQSGAAKFTPTTTVTLDNFDVSGCSADWFMRLIGVDGNQEIQERAQASVQSWIDSSLQSAFLPQTIPLRPDAVNLTYQLHSPQFVPSNATSSSRGYVMVHASCAVSATAPNGTTQRFPDPGQPWTGGHNAQPLNTSWARTRALPAAGEAVLLGGVRAAPQLLTMVLQGLHYSGALSPKNESDVRDAHLFFDMDMAQPTAFIKGGPRRGFEMREQTLRLQVDCLDRKSSNSSRRYQLLDARFANVTQELAVHTVGPTSVDDQTALGLVVQIWNSSMGDAHFEGMNSSGFIGTQSQLKALSLGALRRSLPAVNRMLLDTPIKFCTTCALAPLVPHPSVAPVPSEASGGPGYLEVSWHCACNEYGYYQKCQGFRCPEALREAPQLRPRPPAAAAPGPLAAAGRRLHAAAAGAAARLGALGIRPWGGAPPAAGRPRRAAGGSGAPVLLGAFPGAACGFGPGGTFRFATANLSQCTEAGGLSELGPAYVLDGDGEDFALHSGCGLRNGSCEGCRATLSLRARTCTRLGGVSIFLEVPDGSSTCIGGSEAYPDTGAVLLATDGAPGSSRSQTTFATRLGSSCARCGAGGNLSCAALPRQGGFKADLFCENCSLETCAIRGLVGTDAVPVPKNDSLGNSSGFSMVLVTTPSRYTILRACPSPSRRAGDGALLASLLGAVLVSSLLGAGWAAARRRRGACGSPRALARGSLARGQRALGTARGVLASWRARGQRALGTARGVLASWRASAGSACTACLGRLPRAHLRWQGEAAHFQSALLRLCVQAWLLVACGAVWFWKNPMVGLLASMREQLSVEGFDMTGAEHIVEVSRSTGLAIFVAVALLSKVQFACGLVGLEPRPGPGAPAVPARAAGPGRAWWRCSAAMLFEGTAGVALLALTFWQRDFVQAYESAKGQGGEMGFLSGGVAATASVEFSIRLLLTWIAPFLMTVRIVPAVATTTVAHHRASAGAQVGPVLPYLLGLLLTHETIAVVLAMTYFHSGYISTVLFEIVLGGTVLNVCSFLICSDSLPCHAGAASALCAIIGAYQSVLVAYLGYTIGNGWLAPFLAVSSAVAAYSPWAAVTTAVQEVSLSLPGVDCPPRPAVQAAAPDAAEAAPAPGGLPEPLLSFGTDGRPVAVAAADPACPAAAATAAVAAATLPAGGGSAGGRCALEVYEWLLEKQEAQDAAAYGSRIKWRRLCLLLGTTGLVVSTLRDWGHCQRVSPWDDVNAMISSMVGDGAEVSRSSDSFLAPLVDQYGSARGLRLALNCCGAVAFGAGAVLDLVGSQGWAPARKMLDGSRTCGIVGTLLCAAALLAYNLPDYVGLLDFGPTLGHCGSGFCQGVSDSMRAALGSGLLAQAGVDFVPMLVALPWTLFRIGFFLSEDKQNSKAVGALMWATIMCMFRLSLLPATIAYIATADSQIVLWYAAFLVLPLCLLSFIAATGRHRLGWYFLWGWGFFAVPLFGMTAVALQEDWWTLMQRAWQSFQASWPSFLAEFTLSDVVISDVFFLLIYGRTRGGAAA